MARHMILMDPHVGTSPEMLVLIADGKYRAALVHMMALLWVSQQDRDGILHPRALRLVHGRPSDARALVAAELWELAPGGGWRVLGWADNQLYRPREVLSKTRRSAIFARDGFVCVLCGATDRLSIDHIRPWSKGGTNNPENLQTLCLSCNASKGNR